MFDGVIKVLLVDDNRDFCELMKDYLQGRDDMEVVGVAYNGLEGMDLIEQKNPDVVILDIIMPHLDGIGVLEELNKKGPGPGYEDYYAHRFWASGSNPENC